MFKGGLYMSYDMSIARAAMTMNEFKLQQAVNIEMLKKTMELQELSILPLISQMPNAAPPSGSVIDVKA